MCDVTIKSSEYDDALNGGQSPDALELLRSCDSEEEREELRELIEATHFVMQAAALLQAPDALRARVRELVRQKAGPREEGKCLRGLPT